MSKRSNSSLPSESRVSKRPRFISQILSDFNNFLSQAPSTKGNTQGNEVFSYLILFRSYLIFYHSTELVVPSLDSKAIESTIAKRSDTSGRRPCKVPYEGENSNVFLGFNYWMKRPYLLAEDIGPMIQQLLTGKNELRYLLVSDNTLSFIM